MKEHAVHITAEEILEGISQGVIVIDRAERVRYCNRAAREMIALSAEEIIDRKINEVIPYSDMGQIFRMERNHSVNLKINEKPYISNRSLIQRDGQVVAAVAVIQESGDIERLLAKLKETESVLTNLETIFENAYDGVIVINKEGIVTRITQAYCRFLGIQQEDAIGYHVTKILPNSRMHIVTQTGKAEIGELMKIHGKEAVVMRIPLRENGEVVGAVGKVMFRNVDEIRSIAEKLNLLETKVKLYEKELQQYRKNRYTFDDLIGESRPFREVKEIAEKAAMGKSTVLLLGESGTGKELFAHAIHAASARHRGPFIRVNCSAIPEELLESELFGYEEGAFTGAKRGGKPGKFLLADGGTIFLDEIGDLPLAMQAKLLRVLQEKEIEPLGSVRLRKVDVRIIAATHRDLEKMVEAGEFRQDLFYRLHVIPILIPPLRERIGDIPLLTSAILISLFEELGISSKEVDEEVMHLFRHYHWPGNVRELYNVLERSVVVSEGNRIEVGDLPLYLLDVHERQEDGEVKPLAAAVREAEISMIEKALKKAGGNKAEAAKRLGIHRANLYRKMARYGMAEM